MTAMRRGATTRNSSATTADSNKSSSLNVVGGDQFQTERLHAKLKVFDEIETDRESSASSEDMESPRSVFSKVRRWPPLKNLSVRVHSQILRIREEDSHLGEDVFGEYCLISASRDNNKFAAGHDDHVAVVYFSRPALPASPLGSKTNIN